MEPVETPLTDEALINRLYEIGHNWLGPSDRKYIEELIRRFRKVKANALPLQPQIK